MKIMLHRLLILVSFGVPVAANAAVFLGAEVQNKNVPTDLWRLGFVGTRACVTTVPQGSSAQRSGLKKGDIILVVNGKKIDASAELKEFENLPALKVVIYNSLSKFKTVKSTALSETAKEVPPASGGIIYDQHDYIADRAIVNNGAADPTRSPVPEWATPMGRLGRPLDEFELKLRQREVDDWMYKSAHPNER